MSELTLNIGPDGGDLTAREMNFHYTSKYARDVDGTDVWGLVVRSYGDRICAIAAEDIQALVGKPLDFEDVPSMLLLGVAAFLTADAEGRP